MDSRVSKQLEYINKLIFVERYAEAERLLKQLVESPLADCELLVHLRRIELGAKLGKLNKLHRDYLKRIKRGVDISRAELCLVMVEQLGSFATPTEIVQRFQKHIQEYGPSAAAYYGIAFTLESMGNYDRAIYNYEQSIKLDPSWYPSYFGLSQIHYHKEDEQQGDQYFYMFENAAPYNVYGNFEVHRKLYKEFVDEDRYDEAEAAISTLSDWWVENKGHCPVEIHIHELFAMAKLAELKGDKRGEKAKREQGGRVARSLLAGQQKNHSMCFFVAKTLEEFGEQSLALDFYKQALKSSGGDPQVIQRIGSQFLSLGEYEMAKHLFQEAYESFPENPDVRFCLLVAKLKIASVNVEDYLVGKERLRQLVRGSGDRVELLSLLHSLMNKFQDDPEIQQHMGETYLKLGNTDRASRHFSSMYDLDPLNPSTAMRFASHIVQYDSHKLNDAAEILEAFSGSQALSRDLQLELHWLQAQLYAQKSDYRRSNEHLRSVLHSDPWNIAYLVRDLLNRLYESGSESIEPESVLEQLAVNVDAEVDWVEFDEKTDRFVQVQDFENAYLRLKLRFLFESGSYEYLSKLTAAAAKWRPQECISDLLRLINTNFDAPHIYWAIGALYKDLWQLQAATTWFEHILNHAEANDLDRAKAYLDLADSFLWQEIETEKAVEYAKLAIDMRTDETRRAEKVLVHALICAGRVREAQKLLDQLPMERDIDTLFLRGLIAYRNGATQKAKEVWKPVLTIKSESVRSYNIKQEVMRFYFEGQPYLKAN